MASKARRVRELCPFVFTIFRRSSDWRTKKSSPRPRNWALPPPGSPSSSLDKITAEYLEEQLARPSGASQRSSADAPPEPIASPQLRTALLVAHAPPPSRALQSRPPKPVQKCPPPPPQSSKPPVGAEPQRCSSSPPVEDRSRSRRRQPVEPVAARRPLAGASAASCRSPPAAARSADLLARSSATKLALFNCRQNPHPQPPETTGSQPAVPRPAHQSRGRPDFQRRGDIRSVRGPALGRRGQVRPLPATVAANRLQRPASQPSRAAKSSLPADAQSHHRSSRRSWSANWRSS